MRRLFRSGSRIARRPARVPQPEPRTVRGEYESLGRCGGVPLGEDAPLAGTVLPCSLLAGHEGGHRSPSGWAWPNRSDR